MLTNVEIMSSWQLLIERPSYMHHLAILQKRKFGTESAQDHMMVAQ